MIIRCRVHIFSRGHNSFHQKLLRNIQQWKKEGSDEGRRDRIVTDNERQLTAGPKLSQGYY